MRNRHFICYDVRDPKRLADTYKKMNGYGVPVQYSVFLCDLNPKELVLMKKDLTELLNLNEDQVLIIDAGSVNGRGLHCVNTIGEPLSTKKESTIIV